MLSLMLTKTYTDLSAFAMIHEWTSYLEVLKLVDIQSYVFPSFCHTLTASEEYEGPQFDICLYFLSQKAQLIFN